MGLSRPLIVLFSSFFRHKSNINRKSLNAMLGIQTQGGRMVVQLNTLNYGGRRYSTFFAWWPYNFWWHFNSGKMRLRKLCFCTHEQGRELFSGAFEAFTPRLTCSAFNKEFHLINQKKFILLKLFPFVFKRHFCEIGCALPTYLVSVIRT